MNLRARIARTRVSIVVGADAVTAVVEGAGAVRVERTRLVLPERGEDVDAALDCAFADLAARLRPTPSTRGLRVTMVLLPPHADARLIALPPVRRDEAEAVIRRDAARHFVGSAVAKVVAVLLPPAPARRRADRAPVFAAAAVTSLVEALRGAALRAGWRVERIVPAHAAWIAAAERASSHGSTDAPVAVVAVTGDTANMVRLQRGAVTQLRRLPAADTSALAAALGGGPGAASVFADEAVAGDIERVLTDAGWNVTRGPFAAEAAGQHGHDARLELVPESVVAEQEQRHKAVAAKLATAAAVLLLAAAGVHLWGARCELDYVRAQRAALRPQVAPLLATRDSLDRLRERAVSLRTLAAAPVWTRALFDIALLLPPDAHLMSLRGTGDTLVVSAQGARAGAALQALRDAASLRDVRLQGPIERDLEAGTTTLERFTLQARLVTGDSAARARGP
jgi:hypothetical protein